MTPDSELIVLPVDIRNTLFCMRAARPWFAKNEISWDDFLDGKITAAVMLATDDDLARQVVETARARVG